MILVTGAAGFIASCLSKELLNQDPNLHLILSDDFGFKKKSKNVPQERTQLVDRNKLFQFLKLEKPKLEAIFHLGARTDTSETDVDLFDTLNVNFSKNIWHYASKEQIPLLYASSASTYGDGSLGFDDDHSLINNLRPLNPYAESKQAFDLWALEQNETPPQWYGVKFFNVYGPNEYHKARMASVILHAFRQINETGAMKLFRSHRQDYANGEQSRDFIFIGDVIKMCQFLINENATNGIYNIGTGKARSFLDLVNAVFSALELKPKISFIDTPIDIRDNYQYFTEAKMDKLFGEGYDKPITSLEIGAELYVKNYLIDSKYY